jgi:hypothetical protein
MKSAILLETGDIKFLARLFVVAELFWRGCSGHAFQRTLLPECGGSVGPDATDDDLRQERQVDIFGQAMKRFLVRGAVGRASGRFGLPVPDGVSRVF